jgi:hypothetical protein
MSDAPLLNGKNDVRQQQEIPFRRCQTDVVGPVGVETVFQQVPGRNNLIFGVSKPHGNSTFLLMLNGFGDSDGIG